MDLETRIWHPPQILQGGGGGDETIIILAKERKPGMEISNALPN